MLPEEPMIDQKELLEYSHLILVAMQKYHDAKRRQLVYARLWDEYYANGMAEGAFAGKNEATRLGEAVNSNLELWAKLKAYTDEAVEAEHKFKEAMVIDKWIGRTIKMLEILKENQPAPVILTHKGDSDGPISQEEYDEELARLMKRRLGG